MDNWQIPLDRCDPILLAIGQGMHEELDRAFLGKTTNYGLRAISLCFSATHALDVSAGVFCPQSIVTQGSACVIATYDANAIKIWYPYREEQVFRVVQYNEPRAVELLVEGIERCIIMSRSCQPRVLRSSGHPLAEILI